MEITGRLEQWYAYVVTDEEDVIMGVLYNDSKNRFKDGTHIHTSGIKFGTIGEGDVVQTRNSTYLLGVPWKDGDPKNSADLFFPRI